jgi:hypothetical protein
MKRILFLFLLVTFLFAQKVFTQSPAKTQTQVPSKTQINSQLQKVINDFNDKIADKEKEIAEAKKNKEDEETIKGMEDDLVMLKKQLELIGGVKKGISNAPEKSFQNATEREDGEGVPKKDITRINVLPKETLTDPQLILFVQKVNAEVNKNLPVSQRNNGKELYDEINSKEKSPPITGNIGVQCWMVGSTDMGLYLLGRACLDDMSNTDNLCNYASCLSMVGGEHLAIPILQHLEKKYPGNTTILNNLGQAWYGLGETTKAKKYLDNTMHFISVHPMANETKAEIDESEGNTRESTESLKRSIKEDYTPEKEARINKRGGTLIPDDIDDPGCSKAAGTAGTAQTLGIEKFFFMIPGYPMEGGVTAAIQRMEWDDFREKLREAKSKIEDEIEQLKIKAKAYQDKLVSVKNDTTYTTNSAPLKPYNNRQYKTAGRKLTLLVAWGNERVLSLAKKIMEADDTIGRWRDEYNKANILLMKNIVGDDNKCGERKALAASFNMKANTLWHMRNNEWLNFQKEYLDAQARLCLCAFTDTSLYELNIATIKSSFLTCLAGLRCEFEVGCIQSKPDKPGGKVLPDYDEMNCQYKTELSIPYAQKLFSIKIECNKMTTEFDLKYIKGSLEENLANGKYHGRVEVEQKIGSDDFRLGPVKMGGAKISVGAGVEFNEGGIQDVYVTGKAQLKAGPVSVSSADARVSVITGNSSVTGRGALSGINIGN